MIVGATQAPRSLKIRPKSWPGCGHRAIFLGKLLSRRFSDPPPLNESQEISKIYQIPKIQARD